jgi:hypothetical protein
MGLLSRIKQAIKPEDADLRMDLAPSAQAVPEMPSIPIETIPEVSVRQESVASPSKPSIGSATRKKSLISPEMEARIKAKEEKKKAAAERRKQKQQVKQELVRVLPVQDAPVAPIVKPEVPPQLVSSLWKPGQSGNPSGRPKTKHVKDALEKVIAQARLKTSSDPLVTTRLEALMHKIYEMAMDEDAELDEVLEAAKFISERLEGKPASEVEENGEGKPALTININATRFGIQPAIEQGEVINVQPL